MDGHSFRVAICGAGVGGLMLAVILSQHPNIQVDVYEAAHELREVGAGIGMWPRTWKIMKKLGLADALARKSIIPAEGIPKVAFQFRKGDEPAGGRTFQTLTTPGGLISFHRPDFQGVLLDRLAGSSVRTHTGKRVVSYAVSDDDHKGEITVVFADGAATTCDLLVGADGIKSAVRACMLSGGRDAGAARPRWSGTMAYRATIDAAALKARRPGHRVLDTPHVYLGKDTMMTVYPMARGTLVNFAAFRADYAREDTTLDGPAVTPVSSDTFAGDFVGWEEEVRCLIDCVPAASRWAVHTVQPLRSFVAGKVILLGDAAHAMMPYQGSGAGQSIEDAYVLGTLLTHPRASRRMLKTIGSVYDAVRRPIAQGVARASRDAGLLYTLNYPGLNSTVGGGARDEAGLQEVFSRLRSNWEWAWETTVDADVQRAVEMLEAGSGA